MKKTIKNTDETSRQFYSLVDKATEKLMNKISKFEEL